MILEKLEMSNFKSFYGEHSIDFLKYEPGLHFIVGQNKHIEKLEGNGVGKSTLFEAIFWVLYGRTLRGVSAGNVTSWGENETSVTVHIGIEGTGRYSIQRRRGRGKNQLTWRAKTKTEEPVNLIVEQDEIDSIIKMPSTLFGPAFMRGQFSNMFFECAPAEQLSVMTDILSLQDWSNLSKTCSSKAKEKERELATVEGKLSTKKEAIKKHKEEIEWAEEQYQHWEKSNKEEVTELRKLKKQLKEESKELSQSILVTETKKEKLDEKYAVLKINSDDIENEVQTIEAQVADFGRRMDAEDRDLSKITDQIDRASDLLGTDCPICFQEVTKDSMSHLEDHYQANKEEAENNKAKLKKKSDKLSNKHKSLKQNMQDAAYKIDTVSTKKDNLDSKLHREQREKLDVDSRLEAATKQEHKVASLKNPGTELVERQKQAHKDSKSDIKELKEELVTIEKEEQTSQFWIGGFRDVRLFVIEQALGALQMEVNNSLSGFGLSDFTIGFACEKENKSGSVSNKFDVLVTSPHSKQAVPWSVWSGGEYQRLRLACELGVSNLILDSRGISTSWEVWDEPTTHLSKQGVQDLMMLLRQRAQELKRSIFVIDHVARDFPFDSVTEIVKNDSKSEILT